MKGYIKLLKATYENLRYSNLINGRKVDQWWFTISPHKFFNQILHLALLDSKRNRIYILRVDARSTLKDILPRGEVHRAGEYDLYFKIVDDDISIRYLTIDGYIEYSCINSIVEIIEKEDLVDKSEKKYAQNYVEGKILYSRHRSRERNQKLVREAKQNFKEKHQGNIFCEICGFNFQSEYGIDYIEVHHINALHLGDENTITTLADVCLVCANCHRIIHSKVPYFSVDEVRELLVLNKGKGFE